MAPEVPELPTAESIAKYVRKNAPAVKETGAGMMAGMGHGRGMESVREDDYEGHHIVIRTSYQIEVDGKDIMAHLALTNDGQVQYHGLPNYSFDSAMDLVKKMIDVYPDDFPAGEKAGSAGGAGGMEMDMPGMSMKKPAARKSSAKKPAAKKSAKTGKRRGK